MKTARELCPEECAGKSDTDQVSYFDVDYSDIVKSFGYEILSSKHCGSYQGSIFFIMEEGTRVGFLEVYYGSCSGCDALCATDTIAGLDSIISSIHDDITWHESRYALARKITDNLTDNDHYWDDEEKEFLVAALKFLE